MKKLLLTLIFALSATGCTNTVTLNDLVADHNQAFVQFKKYIHSINFRYWEERYGNEVCRHFSYYGTPQALASMDTYQDAFKKLYQRYLLDTCGDAFMLGIAAAVVNRAAGLKPDNGPFLTLACAATVGMLVDRNSSMGTVPYADTRYLRLHDNLFANISVRTFANAITAVTIAGLSYSGTQYAWQKIASWYKEFKK